MIDVSSHNGIIAWQRVKAAGVSGAYIRATMGLRGVDTRFHDNAQEALAEGLQVGFYALLRPEYDGGAQAEHFLRVVDEMDCHLAHAVDVELDGLSALQVRSFLSRVEAVSGIRAAVYTSATHWVQTDDDDDAYFSRFPLWVAMYNPTASEPDLPRSWTTWFLWQYTSSGTVDGIKRRVDLNRSPPVAPPSRFELRYPVDAPVRVTQRFGERYDYYMREFGLPGHEGLDMGGTDGDPIYAAADGTVKLIARDDGKHPYGNQIRLTHVHGADTYITIYAHLRGFVAGLMQGDTVRVGQQIGYMDSTGNSTGTHLHFGVKKNGVNIDPEIYLK